MKFNKVVFFLCLANLFIASVVISLLFRGVTPKARKMVKWSSVKSPGQAGDRLALFLFPLLKESKRVNIQKGLDFSELFFQAFLKRARKEGVQTEIFREDLSDRTPGFSLFIFQLKNQTLAGLCKKGDKIACLGKRNFTVFNKKKRDPSLFWITMDRLGKNKAVLFFQPPEGRGNRDSDGFF